MNKIEFPQPLVTAPDENHMYWFVTVKNDIDHMRWEGDSLDKGILAAGHCYLTQAEARRRCEWNKQEMARLVIPAWFRELGPEIESWHSANVWKEWKLESAPPMGWDKVDPARFRTKPQPAPDIVKVINGVEYRWPATVTSEEPCCLRYVVDQYGNVCEHQQANIWGNRTHFTRKGAETQAAALKNILS
jgi:hypothetical protein